MGIFECLGIVGRGDMKLICGIRIAGMNRRTRKEDKVNLITFRTSSYIFIYVVNSSSLISFKSINIMLSLFSQVCDKRGRHGYKWYRDPFKY